MYHIHTYTLTGQYVGVNWIHTEGRGFESRHSYGAVHLRSYESRCYDFKSTGPTMSSSPPGEDKRYNDLSAEYASA